MLLGRHASADVQGQHLQKGSFAFKSWSKVSGQRGFEIKGTAADCVREISERRAMNAEFIGVLSLAER